MLHITIETLASFPEQLERCFAGVPRELTNWRPDSWAGIPCERLTAIEQICHIRDIEIEGYHVRFERTLSEPGPVLADIDGEALARTRGYAAESSTAVLAAFRSARTSTITTLHGLTEQQLGRVAIFEGQPTTLRGLVYLLCSHDQRHLSGMHWLLGKAQATEIAA